MPTFLDMVGQELRAPPNAISGISEILSEALHDWMGNPYPKVLAEQIKASGRSVRGGVLLNVLAGRRGSLGFCIRSNAVTPKPVGGFGRPALRIQGRKILTSKGNGAANRTGSSGRTGSSAPRSDVPFQGPA